MTELVTIELAPWKRIDLVDIKNKTKYTLEAYYDLWYPDKCSSEERRNEDTHGEDVKYAIPHHCTITGVALIKNNIVLQIYNRKREYNRCMYIVKIPVGKFFKKENIII